MSGKVINLRRARKSVARAEQAQKASENAAKFGEAKAAKTLNQARAAKAQRDLDGHKRDD